MQSSPNIGERSAKCVSATLKVSFPLQFWVFKPETAFKKKKNIKKTSKNHFFSPQFSHTDVSPNVGERSAKSKKTPFFFKQKIYKKK